MTRLSPRRALLLAGACGALAACVVPPPRPFARLDDIQVSDRPAQPEEFGRVKVIRAGVTQDGAPGMDILKGDTVTTADDGVAAVTLAAGWEVIFEPGTIANIENPSIFVKWGKLIIKKLQEVKEALTVNNEFVSAGAEGTVFVFEVTRGGEVKVDVLEGRVVVNSRLARFAAMPLSAGSAGTIRATDVRPAVRQINPQTARVIQQRVITVEQAKRLRVPINRVVVPVAPTRVTVPPAAPPPPPAPAIVPGVVVSPEMRVRTCTVPNIIERSEDAANQALGAANLKAGKIERLAGKLVTKQAPAAGTSVVCGSTVDFTIGTPRD